MELCYQDDAGKDWHVCFQFGDHDIAVGADVPVGLGVVLVAYGDLGWLMVQKANKKGYEFSELWAFPGGMVRKQHGGTDLKSSLRTAAGQRLSEETGLDASRAIFTRAGPPLVTSYTAKGSRRYTLVVPLCCEGIRGNPTPSDPTVSQARWRTPVGSWDTIAPANRLFAGRLAWAQLGSHDRVLAAPHLLQALEECNEWSAEVHLHETKAMWLSQG